MSTVKRHRGDLKEIFDKRIMEEYKPNIDIYLGDNLQVLKQIKSESVDLIYIDPPFNTGKVQSRKYIKTVKSEDGDRRGFKGQKYKTEFVGEQNYMDVFDDFHQFLKLRLLESIRILKDTGSLFLHLDYREVHYAKVICDEIYGRDSFINEIIWSYDYGARSKKRWSAKHENILWYAKDPNNYTFRYDDIDRIPYLAPSLVGPAKAALGKTPTDSWWHTIVSPTGKEKTGYPTQKPLGILRRIVNVHSRPKDTVMDFFAGSGTTGLAAIETGRNAILVDNNPEAIKVMKKRFAGYTVALHDCE